MGFQIEDGLGNGVRAAVSPTNRLLVRSDIRRQLTVLSLDAGLAFYLATDFVPLTTTGSFNGVFYMKNTSQSRLCVASLRTCGNVIQEWKMRKNPTTGTLIDSGTDGEGVNINFESGNKFDATFKTGVDGQTVTDGTHLAQWINDVGSMTEDFDGAVVLGVGQSLTLECKPAAAGDVSATMLIFFERQSDIF